MVGAPRRIWLCADDYGLAPGINEAIRALVARGRINAVSVMVVGPAFNREQADALAALNAGVARAALGLHVTLTGPFSPLSPDFAPRRGHRFPSLPEMGWHAAWRRLSRTRLHVEIDRQLRRFIDLFGRPPDFIDGHQHVQLLPQVGDVLLEIAAGAVPSAWIRQCGRARGAGLPQNVKTALLDLASVAFRRKAKRLKLATNSAFAGAYDFRARTEFPALFPRFLHGMTEGGLIMCHPGFVDATLESLDPLTRQREQEFRYFDSDAFARVLAEHGFALARPGKAAAAP
ncbi:MAG: ChbG/HpnK family deacetylase [Pseudolabrys sp.]|nr:ChbG/HpnK family deacetylase [Pseudolabrys sp.]